MSEPKEGRAWKPKLLSSSLPLEFEAAKILVANGYSVHSDYSYHRVSQGREAEFSVDLRGIRVTSAPRGAKRGCTFDLLVECKFRTRQIQWLFVPELNMHYSTASEHEIVRGIDAFSSWFLTENSWWTTQSPLPVCYKGVEVDVASGYVEPEELRRGIMQLQCAIPPLIRSRIEAPITSFGVDDSTPFFFSTVLVTNAPLLVASSAFSPASVESTKNFAELGQQANCLVLRTPPSQDVLRHSQLQFAGFAEVATRKGIQAVESHRKSQGVHAWELPKSLSERLQTSGSELEAVTDVSCILVCSLPYLATLVRELARVCERVGSAATRELPEHLRV